MDRVLRSHRGLPHLLKGRGRALLREIVAGRTLLAFDFDGTLAPIVDRPEGARMTARMRSLLAALARLYPCAVISGRARNDVRGRLGRIPLFALAGSHGAEVGDLSPCEPRACVRSWTSDLRRRLHRVHGVALEVKPHGVAVHYRAVADKRAAQAVIFSALRGLQHSRHIHGKDVVEVLPIGAPTKGDALRAFRARVKPRFTLYVGDDVTDEDAFSSRGHGSLLPVRVGGGSATAALFRLDAQHEVEELLSALILLAPKRRTWLNDSAPVSVQ